MTKQIGRTWLAADQEAVESMLYIYVIYSYVESS